MVHFDDTKRIETDIFRECLTSRKVERNIPPFVRLEKERETNSFICRKKAIAQFHRRLLYGCCDNLLLLERAHNDSTRKQEGKREGGASTCVCALMARDI